MEVRLTEGTRAERGREGRTARKRVARSAHSVWVAPSDRPPVVTMLRGADAGRMPRLLPIRYYRMASSPFGFFRGAAALMARDLASTPTTGFAVQMAGDAHVSNFGLFATPERNQVFDINDFDETLPGPWEFDVKRLATSFVLAGRIHGHPPRVLRKAVQAFVRAYQRHLADYARATYLDAWYAHLDVDAVRRQVGASGRHLFEHELGRARDRTGFRAFPKIVARGRGGFRIREAPPLIQHPRDPHDRRRVRAVFEGFRTTLAPERRRLFDRYHLVDVVEKVVGVGSVGTQCSVGLFLADTDRVDPLFLQVKEASASVHERQVGASGFANHAERVVVGQRLIQEASDVLLGWGAADGRDFYIRQLRDMAFSSDILALGRSDLLGQAELCGAALARAHARTGDPAALSGYLGDGPGFDEAIGRFAHAYADQTEADHQELRDAIRRGELPSAPDGRRGRSA